MYIIFNQNTTKRPKKLKLKESLNIIWSLILIR